MTNDTQSESPWGQLLTASTAGAQPPAALREAILARVAEEETAQAIARMPAPANDRWLKPWMGMAAMVAIVAFVGVASLSPNPESQRGAPVIAADAGPLPATMQAADSLVIDVAPDAVRLSAQDLDRIAAFAKQEPLCGSTITVAAAPTPAGNAQGDAVQTALVTAAKCPLQFTRTPGTAGQVAIDPSKR